MMMNSDGLSPIVKAINRSQKDQIEVMMETMSLCNSHIDHCRHLKVYFIKLLEMKSHVV